jgi:Flp pilus assembly protein TadD
MQPAQPTLRPDPRAPSALGAAAAALAVLGATCVAYLPAWGGAVIWDDAAHITSPALQGLSGLGRIWFRVGTTQQYYPVLHSAFWLEHRIWGDRVLGYHLANVVLHALAACLFAVTLSRVRPGGSGTERPGAGEWLAAGLFALHPVCTESVAWISEQKNTLSLVFYLLAAIAYLRFDRGRRWGFYFLGLGLFILAILSKSVTATLPAALLLVLAWRKGRLGWRTDILPLMPWLSMGVASGLFTAWVERAYIGARGQAYGLGFVERVFLAGRVVWFYLGKLLWPADLSFIYPRWQVTATFPWSLGFLGLVTALAVLWRLRRMTAAPLVAFLFFVGSMFPALGFLNVYPFVFSYVADHWQYLPSLGIFALAGEGAAYAARGLVRRVSGPAANQARLGLIASAGVLLVVLLGLTRSQAALYRDIPTLYSDTIAKNPDCWMAHGNLGVYLLDKGSTEDAVRHLREAIRIRPDYADAHNNLGNSLARMPGHEPEAIAQLEEALRLDPGMAEAHGNLGLMLVHTPGRFNEGVAHLRAALAGREGEASSARLHADLGLALAQAKDGLEDAMREDRAALALDSGLARAHYGLGLALARSSRALEAIPEYREALRLGDDTAEVRNSLGASLLGTGQAELAVAEYRRAAELRPDLAVLRNNLGIALTAAGRLDDAVASLREALRLAPGYPDAHYNLAVALRSAGRAREAADEFRAAGRPGS